MPDYSKGLIYRIDCNETGDCYIGSTTQGLANRIADHRSKYKEWKKGNRSNCCSFPIIERNNFTYELIEYFPCKNKMELHRKEGEFQRSMECVNKLIAGRTMKEWKDDNKEIIKEKDKKYREDNKEKIKEKNKVYYDDNKEKVNKRNKEYEENNKEKVKERRALYKKNNKEKIKEQGKVYREDNKEKEKERKKKYVQNNKEEIKK